MEISINSPWFANLAPRHNLLACLLNFTDIYRGVIKYGNLAPAGLLHSRMKARRKDYSDAPCETMVVLHSYVKCVTTHPGGFVSMFRAVKVTSRRNSISESFEQLRS